MRTVMLFLMTICFVPSLCGQQVHRFVTEIYYVNNSFEVDVNLGDNILKIERMKTFFDVLKNDTSISFAGAEVQSYCSPLGGVTYNKQLSAKRLEVFSDFVEKLYQFPKEKVEKIHVGVAWDELKKLVLSSGMPNKEKLAAIISNYPEEEFKNKRLVNSRNHRLMSFNSGKDYRYMMEHLFPKLRKTTIVLLFHDSQNRYDAVYYNEVGAEKEWMNQRSFETLMNRQAEKTKETVDSVPARSTTVVRTDTVYIPITPVDTLRPVLSVEDCPSRRLLGLKTNLLFDLALTPNLELEIALGKRWSFAMEYMYTNWLKDDDTFCWQLLSGGVEFRRWLGDRRIDNIMNGWFLGAFTSGGLYDLQLKKKSGYQGEFYVMTGLSAGYAKQISRNFGLEFSTGVGYLISDYRKYKVVNEVLIKDGPTMRFTSLFPVKAKVSFIWYLLGKNKKGGVR